MTFKIPSDCGKSFYHVMTKDGGSVGDINTFCLAALHTYSLRDIRLKFDEVNKGGVREYLFTLGLSNMSPKQEDELRFHEDGFAPIGDGSLMKPYVIRVLSLSL